MYDVDFAKKLDEGTAGVTVKGKVNFCLTPKHVVSEPEAKKKYDFWSQFIVVEDKTGGMGANITFGEDEDKKKNGDMVEVRGTIHKYEATNKKTGEKEEKIVLNSAKVVEPEKPKEEPKLSEKGKTEVGKGSQEAKEGKLEEIRFGMDDQDIRKEAIILAFDYGMTENLSIYDCFDLAKTIGVYIKFGEINIKEIITETKLAKKEVDAEKEALRVTRILKEEKVDGTVEPKSKPKVKEKTKEKSAKTTKDLEELFKKGQDIGLPTWVELIGFAVKKDIFPIGTSIEDARVKLLANDEDCYDSLLDFIDIRENVKENVNDLPEDEQPSEDIPF